jgi:hypothetical protein
MREERFAGAVYPRYEASLVHGVMSEILDYSGNPRAVKESI